MNGKENRPPSNFYADINDPIFPDGYFDRYYPLIEEYAKEQAEHAAQGYVALHFLGYGLEALDEGDFYWGPIEETWDLIVELPDGASGSKFVVMDNGCGTLEQLQQGGYADPSHPDTFKGQGVELYKNVTAFHVAYDSVHALVNSDGLILAAPGKVIDIEHEDTQPFGIESTLNDLLASGLSLKFATELIFDEQGMPSVSLNTSAQHDQVGVHTPYGFVPFFTRLDANHPAVRQYNEQLDPQIIRDSAESLQHGYAKQDRTAQAQLDALLGDFQSGMYEVIGEALGTKTGAQSAWRHSQEKQAENTEQPEGWPFGVDTNDDTNEDSHES